MVFSGGQPMVFQVARQFLDGFSFAFFDHKQHALGNGISGQRDEAVSPGTQSLINRQCRDIRVIFQAAGQRQILFARVQTPVRGLPDKTRDDGNGIWSDRWHSSLALQLAAVEHLADFDSSLSCTGAYGATE